MIRTRSWVVLGALIAAAHLPVPVSAQDSTAKRDSAVAKLNTGQQIRISGEAMSRLIGKAGVAANDTLDFAQDDMVRRIPIPAIDTLWVRGGSGKNGALIGAGAMLVLYVVLAAEFQRYCDHSDCGYSATDIAGGVLISTALGASLGAIIGGSIQSWKRKYP